MKISFWIIHGVIDILTQISTAFLPVFLLHHIQISLNKQRPHISSQASVRSRGRNRLPRRRQRRSTPREYLAARLYTLHDKTVREPIARVVRRQIFVEVEDIAVEVGRGMAVRDEGVHLDVAVGSVGEVEGDATDGGGSDSAINTLGIVCGREARVDFERRV